MDPSPKSTIRFTVVAAGILLLVIVITYIFWQFWTEPNEPLSDPAGQEKNLPTEHLIPSVPYWGQYLGTTLSNQEPVAVRTLLDYWNIPDISNDTLTEIFEPSIRDEEGLGRLGTSLVAEMFWELGFEVERFATSSTELLKFFIANNIPVYVRQHLGSHFMPELFSTRVYIGYSDHNQHFVVHDNNFGNNYLIPYSEYEKISPNQSMLVVMPPDYPLSNQPQLESANWSSYPVRLDIMDDLALRDLQIKVMEVNWYKIDALLNKKDNVDVAVKTLEEIVNHDAFTKLHPAARMGLSYDLTGFYMGETPNSERAIEILETITLPLIEQYDFSEPYGEWDRKMDPSVYDHPFYNALPWTRLGYLYLRVGNNQEARSAFNKALDYHPDFEEALHGLSLTD